MIDNGYLFIYRKFLCIIFQAFDEFECQFHFIVVRQREILTQLQEALYIVRDLERRFVYESFVADGIKRMGGRLGGREGIN